MGSECFPAITRCFSSKSMKTELKKRSDSSQRLSTSFRTSGSTSSRSDMMSTISISPPPKKAWEEEMREVFRHFDVDSDGKISASELREYFASVGEYMCDDDAQGVINDLDSDGDGLLEFGDFLRLMGSGKGVKGDEGELKEVFEMFEQEKGSGRITPTGLQRMLCRLGDSKSHDECAAMINIYDVDGDGEIDFKEFYQMMS